MAKDTVKYRIHFISHHYLHGIYKQNTSLSRFLFFSFFYVSFNAFGVSPNLIFLQREGFCLKIISKKKIRIQFLLAVSFSKLGFYVLGFKVPSMDEQNPAPPRLPSCPMYFRLFPSTSFSRRKCSCADWL